MSNKETQAGWNDKEGGKTALLYDGTIRLELSDAHKYSAQNIRDGGKPFPVESVTKMISATRSKGFLTRWAAKLAADYIRGQNDLYGLVTEEDLQASMNETNRVMEEASHFGNQVHAALEESLLGVPQNKRTELEDKEARAFALGKRLLESEPFRGVTWTYVERPVLDVSRCYAGTLDLEGVDGEGNPVLVDYKTTSVKKVREWRLQLAAYAFARAKEEFDQGYLSNVRRYVVWIPRPDLTKAAVVPIDFPIMLDCAGFAAVRSTYAWYKTPLREARKWKN